LEQGEILLRRAAKKQKTKTGSFSKRTQGAFCLALQHRHILHNYGKMGDEAVLVDIFPAAAAAFSGESSFTSESPTSSEEDVRQHFPAVIG
jgi:hypothetical protein